MKKSETACLSVSGSVCIVAHNANHVCIYKLETDPGQEKRSTQAPLSSMGLDDRLMARSAEEGWSWRAQAIFTAKSLKYNLEREYESKY